MQSKIIDDLIQPSIFRFTLKQKFTFCKCWNLIFLQIDFFGKNCSLKMKRNAKTIQGSTSFLESKIDPEFFFCLSLRTLHSGDLLKYLTQVTHSGDLLKYLTQVTHSGGILKVSHSGDYLKYLAQVTHSRDYSSISFR